MSSSPCLTGSAEDRVAAIVRRCGGGRAGRRGWMVRCPAHEDRTPSLSITAKGDHVLLCCFAGCPPSAIVEAIAISMRDLFVEDDWVAPTTPKPPQRRCPPRGRADTLALAFAVDFVLDDVAMLTVDGLVEVLRQAARDPVQWLWVERAFHTVGMTPRVVWQVLFPQRECPYPDARQRPAPAARPITLQGRPRPTLRIREARGE